VRVNAPIDFGITESGILASAYRGTGAYAADGPYKNLRLIARIEDPYALLIAVKAESGITDLAEIARRKLPVKILAGSVAATTVLNFYGLTREAVTSWGGQIGAAMGSTGETAFDVIVGDLATPALNPESSYWTTFTQKWGFLRGVDRPIKTIGKSGEAVFARDDTPDQAAYDIARAIDDHRLALRWFIRPYSYDSRTVAQNFAVPLHPGAARYYREKGYFR